MRDEIKRGKETSPKRGSRRRREKCTKTARAKPRREHPFAARAREYRVKNHAPRDETVSPRFHPLQRLALRKRKFARSSVSFAARHIFSSASARRKKMRVNKKRNLRARERASALLSPVSRDALDSAPNSRAVLCVSYLHTNIYNTHVPFFLYFFLRRCRSFSRTKQSREPSFRV